MKLKLEPVTLILAVATTYYVYWVTQNQQIQPAQPQPAIHVEQK